MKDWAFDTADQQPELTTIADRVAEATEALAGGRIASTEIGVHVVIVADDVVTRLHPIEAALRRMARHKETQTKI